MGDQNDNIQYLYQIHMSSEEIFIQYQKNLSKLLSINLLSSTVREVDSSLLKQKVIYSTIRGHAILGIIRIMTIEFLLYVKEYQSVCFIDTAEIYQVKEIDALPIIDRDTTGALSSEINSYVAGLKDLLQLGFYYSFNYDLTSTKQKQSKNKSKDRTLFESTDLQFFWNYNLYRKFLISDTKPINSHYCVAMICGYVNMFEEEINNTKMEFILISRRSQYHVGTRYLTRGINDDGHCANFCESEQIVKYDNTLLSFTQIRGSAPVFFQQTGMTAQTVITRSSELTIQAFTKHMSIIQKDYSMMFFINLLNKNKLGEHIITEAMETQIKLKSPNKVLRYYFFDMQNECPNDNYDRIELLMQQLKSVANIFQFYCENSDTGEVHKNQSGTIRTNCLDCLDRTNVIQTRISWMILEKMLNSLNLNTEGIFGNGSFFGASKGKFHELFRTIWAENGDFISIQYAGTGSCITTVTKNGSHGIMGLLQHGLVSVTRIYQGNFEDYFKQKCFDVLLQRYHFDNFMSPSMENELRKQEDKFLTNEELTVIVASWNVGGREFKETSNMFDWLFPSNRFTKDSIPDLYLIGLQEIVDLNAKNIIISGNTSKTEYWENIVTDHLNKIGSYVKIKSIDLIGIFLIAFIKEDKKELISNLDALVIKSGMMGNVGNKGSCLIRFNILDSSIAIACNHLSAGRQYSEARRNQMSEILNRSFDKYPKIAFKDYDFFIFFGDLNSRINLDIETCCSMIKEKKYNELLMKDQFRGYRKETSIISQMEEAEIEFAPTYKYNFNSNEYDKRKRTPSWCDRILFKKGSKTIPIAYDRCEYTLSDHRPIYGVYKITACHINHEIRNNIVHELKDTIAKHEKHHGYDKTNNINSIIHYYLSPYDNIVNMDENFFKQAQNKSDLDIFDKNKGLGVSSPVKISRTATDNNKGHNKSQIEREEVNKKMSNFYYK